MSFPLSGKVALVTGASRGIGAAIAKRLAADGASVVVNYFSSEAAAQAVVQDINAQGKGKAVALQADASSLTDGNQLIEETVKIFGQLDIVVHNSAYLKIGGLSEIDEESFDAHFNANVKAPLFMTQTAAKYLKHGGRVIFITSSTTKFTQTSAAPPIHLVYTASKGASEQLVRVLAKDLGTRGITVNALSPGAVDTDLFRNDGKPEEYVKRVEGLFPLGRLPVAHEIAPLAAFLAREEAGWINGQTIMVNGGMAV